MGQTPGEIRRDIEDTRRDMSATLDAIGYRLDIPARMRYRASTMWGGVSDALFGVKEETKEMARDVVSSAAEVIDMAEHRLGPLTAEVQTGLQSGLSTVQSGLSDIKEKVVDTVSSGTSSTSEMAKSTSEMAKSASEMAKSRASAVGSFVKENALVLGVGAFAVALAAGMLIPRTRVEEEKIAPIATELRSKAMESGEKALDKAIEGNKQSIGEKVVEKGQEMAHEAMQAMGGENPRTGQSGMDEPPQSGYGMR